MNDPLQDPIEDYLRRVSAHLGDRGDRERQDILDALRRHILDALQARGGSPTPADVQAVVQSMDDPSDYAAGALAGPAAGPGPAPHRPRGSADRWFLLGLCFLVLNAWVAWRVTRPGTAGVGAASPAAVTFTAGRDGVVDGQALLRWRFDRALARPEEIGRVATNLQVELRPAVAGVLAWTGAYDLVFQPASAWPGCLTFEARLGGDPALPTGQVFAFRTPALRLTEVAQRSLGPDRRARLLLAFNAPPDRRALGERLTLRTRGGRPLAYTLDTESAVSNSVLLETDPVLDGDEVEVRVAAGLPPARGSLGVAEEQVVALALREGLALLGLRAESPAFEPTVLECTFTELIETAPASTFVEVRPPVSFTVEPFETWRGDGCRLRGGFEPGQIYTVTFKPGLASVNGQALTRPLVRQVQFPNRPSSVTFAAPGHYLSPRGSLRIPVLAMNVRELVFRAAPILPANLVQLVMRESGRYQQYYGDGVLDWTDRLTAAGVATTTTVATALNQEARLPLDLHPLLGAAPSGAFVVSAWSEEGDSDHQLVVVTDIGLSARHARNGWLVWANSLREARPLPDTEVVLYAENGAELGRATTGLDGTAFLGVAESEEDEAQPVVLLAHREHDSSYLKLTDTRLPAPAGGQLPYLSGAYEASVFTDRGIYRPGETLHARALVRDRRLACPEPFPAVFRIRQPDGRIFRTVPVTLNEFGAAELTSDLPLYLPTGRYQVELCLPGTFALLGEADLALEDFVPPQVRLSLQAAAARLSAAEPVTIALQADHLFGRPAAGLSAQALVSFEPVAFAPTNWPGFTFVDREKSFARVDVKLGRFTLGEAGDLKLLASLSAAWAPPSALNAVVGVTVTEPSGRPTTKYLALPSDAYPFYIGLQREGDGGAVVAGTTQRVAVVVVQPDGQPAAQAQPLKAVLSSIQYSTVLKRGPDGRYAYETVRTLTRLQEQLVNVGGRPIALPVAPAAAGAYVLVVSDPASGASSSLEFTAAARGQAWVNWSRERPDRVAVEANRATYQPGDTARLTLKTPFAGTALLTVESDRIHEQRVLSLTGTTAVLEVPIRDEYAPNVFCHLTLLRPAVAESVWSAHRASGSALLRVEPAGRRLTATIEAPALLRPQSDLEAVIRLADAQGRPVAGEVTVAAVDEGICLLTDFVTPNPLDDFLRPRLPGVVGFDLYSLLMPVTEASAFGASAPGGGGADSLLRRLNPIPSARFRPVALWQSDLRADSNGIARVRLAVPEFTGQLRLMAVAWNRTQAGSGQAAVTVKRPLVVQPALPRFLAPGDRCVMRVRVFNESGQPLSGMLRVTTGGPLEVAQPERALTLAAGAATTLEVPLQAGELPGAAVVTVEATAGAESYRETIPLSVRPALPPQVATRVGRLAAGEQVVLASPTNWLAHTAVQTVRVSGRPEVRLGRSLDYLLRYPYGCLEQTVSGAFPLLRLPELAAGAIGREETDRLLRAAVLRVLSMQRDQGFVLWPQSNQRNTWAGLYATHFLVECRKAGLEIPDDRLQAALQWARSLLSTAVGAAADSDAWLDDMETRAYVCHVLARAGTPEVGWTARLHEQGARLTAGGRAHVAAALLLSGQPALARDRLARTPLPDPAPWPGLRATLRSGVRDAGQLLLAWLEVEPAGTEAAALADLLLRSQVDGHWGTTQDDAWALLALGTYAARQPPGGNPAVAGRLSGPGLDKSFDARGLVVTNLAGVLTLSNQGPGEVYYLAQAEGVPATGAVPALDQGLLVRRAWLNLAGEPQPLNGLQPGDLVVVRLTVDAQGADVENVVIEDLLPAGLEIENPAFATSQIVPWIAEKTDWCTHRDLRDDRLLLFSGAFNGTRAFYYAARVVTPGRFVLPPVTASAMYTPARRSSHGAGIIEVQP
jgi:uncharacterized protein YfaS (alpha-2-macroglobulin family)